MRNINEELSRMKQLMSHGVSEQYSEEDRLGKGVSGLDHPPDAEWEAEQGIRYKVVHGYGYDYEILKKVEEGDIWRRIDDPNIKMMHHKTQKDAISVIVDKLGGKLVKITDTSKPIAPGDDVDIDSGDLEYGMIPDNPPSMEEGQTKTNLNEGAFEYDPTQVVHKDEDVIVIDQNIDSGDTSEYEYDEEDVTFEDGDWLVINPDEEQGGCGDKVSDGDPVNTNDYDFYGAGPSDMDSDGIPDNEDDQLEEGPIHLDFNTISGRKGGRPMLKPIKPKGEKYKQKRGKYKMGESVGSKTYKVSESQLNMIKAKMKEQLVTLKTDVNGHLLVQSTGSKDDAQKNTKKKA